MEGKLLENQKKIFCTQNSQNSQNLPNANMASHRASYNSADSACTNTHRFAQNVFLE